MLPNTKDLVINQTMVAYGNRENATAFARAKNSVVAITETFNRNQALDMPVTDVATLAENHIKIALLRDVLSDVPKQKQTGRQLLVSTTPMVGIHFSYNILID